MPVVLDREVKLPVEVRVASSFLATWAVPLGRIEPLLPGGLVPYGPLRGRGLASIGMIQYVDSDLGPYNEFALALVCRRAGQGGEVATFIRHLPVNQAFTLEAGRSLWGFPKFMTHSTIASGPDGAAVGSLTTEEGQPILGLRIARGRIPLPRRTTELDTYAAVDGVLRRTPFTMRTAGARMRPGGATLTLGDDHPMADDIRSLRLGRALSTMQVPRMSATFGEAQLVLP